MVEAARARAGEYGRAVKRAWWAFVGLGILMIVVGLLAMFWPVPATTGTVWFVAFLILIAGVVQALQAFAVSGWKGTIWQLMTGGLKVAFGVWLIVNPAVGALALTLFFGIIFVVDGAAKSLFGLVLRPDDGWGWVLLSGLVSLGVGVWVFVALGNAYAVVPGILIGVTLFVEGISWTVIGFAARGLAKRAGARIDGLK